MENREIKFRAWDKINNVMHNNIWSINWDFTPKEPKALLTSVASNDVINSEYILRKPNFILQQFTGLKDKNGKEIYEGDIVEWTTTGTETARAVMEYKYESIYPTQKCHGKYRTTPYINGSSVIIGNIFENPELIIH